MEQRGAVGIESISMYATYSETKVTEPLDASSWASARRMASTLAQSVVARGKRESVLGPRRKATRPKRGRDLLVCSPRFESAILAQHRDVPRRQRYHQDSHKRQVGERCRTCIPNAARAVVGGIIAALLKPLRQVQRPGTTTEADLLCARWEAISAPLTSRVEDDGAQHVGERKRDGGTAELVVAHAVANVPYLPH
eukprot:7379515-Prymnesium_polylepis.1